MKLSLEFLKSPKIKNIGTIITIIWANYLVIHTLLAGKIWLWNLLSFIPPFIFMIVSIISIIINLFTKNIPGILITLISLPLAYINTDINLNFLHKHSTDTNYKQEIAIFNWNTQFWETDRVEQLYDFLKSENADIYQLQEHYSYEGDRRNKYFLKDQKVLEENFPDFNIVAEDEFLTISKYPIIESFVDNEGTYLRTKIDINGKLITFYNVHTPLQLYYPYATTPLELLRDTRTRFYIREEKFAILEEEIKNIENPFYISGDFNTTTAMGKMRFLLSNTTDSFSITDTLFPTTWTALGLKLWRIDYNLASEEITIVSHENIEPQGLSDHWGQKVVISI